MKYRYDLGLMLACEMAAETRAEGRLAWVTWVLGTRGSWNEARRSLSRSSWYRHLRILRKAGLKVPAELGQSDELPASFLGPYRARTATGALLTLPGRPFRVLKPLDEWIVPGVTGKVDSVQFREGAWEVGVQLDGSPGGYEVLPLQTFVSSTEPVSQSVPATN